MKIQTNLNKLYKNLGAVFTHRTKVITEMAQNARRAGATEVTVDLDHDKGIISVADNGSGITDFSNLLHLCESGWDSETKDSEGPYGMGFFATFFCARRVLVESGAFAFDITDIQKLLAGEDIGEPQQTGTHTPGTRVTLYGVDMAGIFVEQVGELFKGFPIPVKLNGTYVERAHAVTAEGYIVVDEPGLGTVCLDWAGLDGSAPTCYTAYLQGLEVGRQGHWGGRHIIVHLDTRQFKGRMPDRDCLLDADQAHRSIHTGLRSIVRRQLVLAKVRGEITPATINHCYQIARRFDALDVLNDVELLPQGTFARYAGVPFERGHGDYSADMHASGVLSKAKAAEFIANAELVMKRPVTPGEWPDGMPNAGARAVWAFMRNVEFLDMPFDAGHWIHTLLGTELKALDEHELEVTAEAVGHIGETEMLAGSFEARLRVCDSVRLDVGGLGAVTLVDTPVFLDVEGFFIPRKGFDSAVILHAASYQGEYDWDEEWEDKEREQLRNLFNIAMGHSPAQVLQAALPSLPSHVRRAVKGKSFHLKTDKDGYMTVKSLTPPKAAKAVQTVVFVSGGNVTEVATRSLPKGAATCVVVDYDNARAVQDKSDKEIETEVLGCDYKQFKKTAKKIL